MMRSHRNKRNRAYTSGQTLGLRKFPFPYRAALSITSDIDCTDTIDQHKKIQAFMNEEIGIPFTNTFFPLHDQSKFSLLSGTLQDNTVILDHINKGLVDAIHSFGEKKDFNRNDAQRVLDELKKKSCRLEVWIDHAESPSNFCKYRFYGRGDIPGNDAYHFDLTKKYGIKFIWTERLTNIVGQGVRLSFNSILNIYDNKHRKDSIMNLGKTLGKIALDYFGYPKYNYFKKNRLVYVTTMRDGQKIYEFVRFNNHYKGASIGDTFEDLEYMISKKVLDQLIKAGGYCIVYTHLGKKFNLNSEKGRQTVVALRDLKEEYEYGNIYLDSAGKILNYYIRHKHLNWSSKEVNGHHNIIIHSVDDPMFGSYVPEPAQLKNFTFYAPEKTKVYIQSEEVKYIRQNPPDHTNKQSITLI